MVDSSVQWCMRRGIAEGYPVFLGSKGRQISGCPCYCHSPEGICLQVNPSIRAASPPRLFRIPPSCFRKKATPASMAWSRRSRTQSSSIGRAERLLSPPTITHCTSPARSHGLKSSASSSGSADTKRTGAGTRANTLIRGAYLWFSTEVPIHTCAGHTRTESACSLRIASYPHVRGPYSFKTILVAFPPCHCSPRSFRQDLEHVSPLRGFLHDVENAADKVVRHAGMEHVRHAVNEHPARFRPS